MTAYKVLVLDETKYEEDKTLTLLTAGVKEEAVYAEFHGAYDAPDVVELATDLKQIIKMRDFLTSIINKAAKNHEVTGDDFDYYGNLTTLSLEEN